MMRSTRGVLSPADYSPPFRRVDRFTIYPTDVRIEIAARKHAVKYVWHRASSDEGQNGPRLIRGKKNTAEYDVSFSQLIDCLESLAGGVDGGKELWIYRGQSDSECCLQPYALRADGCKKIQLLDSAINRWDTELKESSEHEWIPSTDYESNPMNRVMRLFYILASRQGLDLPSQMTDRNLLINPSSFMISSVDGDETTNGAYLELAAIAQHYGFPTLLLDWTLDPLCALYFAVRGAMDGLASRSKHYDIREGSFSIFALKASKFNLTKPEVLIRTYTHHSNRNLIAQRGLFTYVYRNSLDDRRTILDAVDELEVRELNIDSGNLVEGEPVLIKFNIRYSEVIEAMDYLKQMFKTSDTFFPGYEGIVMAMKDHVNYQIVKERLNSSRSARPR